MSTAVYVDIVAAVVVAIVVSAVVAADVLNLHIVVAFVLGDVAHKVIDTNGRTAINWAARTHLKLTAEYMALAIVSRWQIPCLKNSSTPFRGKYVDVGYRSSDCLRRGTRTNMITGHCQKQ